MKNKSIIIVILIVLLIAILGVLLYFNYNKPVLKEIEDKKPKEEIIYPIMSYDDYFHITEVDKIITFDFDLLDNKLPNRKENGNININITVIVDDEEIVFPGKIKVQGSSTADWPKKNWSLSFYKDEERTEEILLKVGDSIISDKWILKADWKDTTQLRKYLSYNLWGDMVSTRVNEVTNSSIKTDNAQGYPYTYMALVLIDGKHYGINLLLTGHDYNNFNIDKSNEKHLYFEFDGRASKTCLNFFGGTWKKFNSDCFGNNIEGYYPKEDNYSELQINAINELGKFINSDLETFKKDFDKYFDKLNIIDMNLLQEIVYDWDGFCTDMEVVTYDLEKFYILPWDKDNTFGLYKEHSGIYAKSSTLLYMNYTKEEPQFMPWYKTYVSFKEDYENRYKELRDKEIFSVNNLKRHIDFVYGMITEEMWQDEKEKWKNRPGEKVQSREQIESWFSERLEMLDKHFNYN